MIELKSRGREQTAQIARSLGEKLPYGSFVALFGDLGAGKTAFTSGFAAGMGIDEPVSSPTFAIMNEYRQGDKTLCHFDMYRISGWDDLYSTVFFDCVDSGSTIVTAWSENIENALPDYCIRVEIEKGEDENERIIRISGCDDIEITCG